MPDYAKGIRMPFSSLRKSQQDDVIVAILDTLALFSPLENAQPGQVAPRINFLYDGLFAYADGINWNPNNAGEGFYWYDAGNSVYVPLDSRRLPLTTKTADYTAKLTDCVIIGNATSGNIAITLPTAIGCNGQFYSFKKTDASANTVTITGVGGQTIEGAANKVLGTQYQTTSIVSDNANWWII